MITVYVCWTACAMLLILFMRTNQKERPSRDSKERIQELIRRAAWHRDELFSACISDNRLGIKYHHEQLEAEVEEFVKLHGYQLDTPEGDRLEDVIWCAVDYSDAKASLKRLELEQ